MSKFTGMQTQRSIPTGDNRPISKPPSEQRFLVKKFFRRNWFVGMIIDQHNNFDKKFVYSKTKENREIQIDREINKIRQTHVNLDKIVDDAIRYAERRDDYIYNNTHTREEAEWEVR